MRYEIFVQVFYKPYFTRFVILLCLEKIVVDEFFAENIQSKRLDRQNYNKTTIYIFSPHVVY